MASAAEAAYTRAALVALGLYAWELARTAAGVERALVLAGGWRRSHHVVGSACRLVTLVALVLAVVCGVDGDDLSAKPAVAVAALSTAAAVLALALAMSTAIALTPRRALHLPLGVLFLFTTAFACLDAFSAPGTLSVVARFFLLACYAVLLVLVLLPSRTRGPPLLGQNVIDVYVLAYTALLALHISPAVLVLVSLNPYTQRITDPLVLALTAVCAVSTALRPRPGGPPAPTSARAAETDLFAHSSVVLGPSASAPPKSTFSSSRAGQPSLHIATADLEADPFPLASPPAWGGPPGWADGDAPDWAPARLSMDSAQISPIQFGGGNVLYAHA